MRHLDYYLKNGWSFQYYEERCFILDDYVLVTRDDLLALKCEQKEKPKLFSLLVIGPHMTTLEQKRDISKEEFDRLVEVIKLLTQ